MLSKQSGIAFALGSAALFGASTPLAKIVLGEGVSPWLLAGVLYLGSGLGLGAYHLFRRATAKAPAAEAPLRRTDLPWLAAAILMGGIAGPLLLMLGLAATSASSASLLLNVEGLATMAIAWLVFRENADTRILIGATAILAGAIVLSWNGPTGALGWGAVLIVGACVAWGIDNNVTRKISASDPVQIAMIKGLVAGVVNMTLALALGAHLPSATILAAGAAIGLAGYGISLVLFVLGLRHLGAARTGAYFSTAPFVGALLSIVLLDEPVTYQLAGGALLMAIGLYLHLAERHEHEHAHDELEHEHRHVHDEHHQHAHGPSDPPGEPHTHWHRHAPLVHAHPHYPDLHHRHDH
jgi:drug/metabolite transporter (DMT)-like permease